MQTFRRYIEKHVSFQPFINLPPNNQLKNIVVIPCFNEPDILQTLISLKNCQKPVSPVEVIIVINSGEHVSENIIKQNTKTLHEITEWAIGNNTHTLKFHTIYLENIPKKIAGAGFARKVGMDEAIRRFEQVNNSEGIISSLDADSKVASNYLIEIEKLFDQHPETDACSIYFEHPLSGADFPPVIYDKIAEYELYMRYYSLSLKYTGFPYYYPTVGSSFAVKAETYCKQGGMNKKQAGEDFYFLHKIMPLGNYRYLKTTTVYPSPRPSNRVPFGTGPVIKSAIEAPDKEFEAYDFKVFIHLHNFFSEIDRFFKIKNLEFSSFSFHPSIVEFLQNNNFKEALDEINGNTASIANFKKRLLRWFDAFRIIKYINFAHENYYKKLPVNVVACSYLKNMKYIQSCDTDIKKLLKIFRQIERAN